VEIELLKRIMDGQASCLAYVLLAAGVIFVVKFMLARAKALAKHEGWTFLDWKEPIDGGAVASNKTERRLRPAGDWALISVALESEAILTNQERNKDWKYRVTPSTTPAKASPAQRLPSYYSFLLSELRSENDEVRRKKALKCCLVLHPSYFTLRSSKSHRVLPECIPRKQVCLEIA